MINVNKIEDFIKFNNTCTPEFDKMAINFLNSEDEEELLKFKRDLNAMLVDFNKHMISKHNMKVNKDVRVGSNNNTMVYTLTNIETGEETEETVEHIVQTVAFYTAMSKKRNGGEE